MKWGIVNSLCMIVMIVWQDSAKSNHIFTLSYSELRTPTSTWLSIWATIRRHEMVVITHDRLIFPIWYVFMQATLVRPIQLLFYGVVA
jgi:hypothetical protein